MKVCSLLVIFFLWWEKEKTFPTEKKFKGMMKEKLRLFYLSPTDHNYANNGCKYMIILLQMWSYFIQLDGTSACSFLKYRYHSLFLWLMKMKHFEQFKKAKVQYLYWTIIRRESLLTFTIVYEYNVRIQKIKRISHTGMYTCICGYLYFTLFYKVFEVVKPPNI